MNYLIKQVFNFYKEYRDEKNILIYQMGKVGSTTIENSIPNSIHLHTLYNNPPCWIHQKIRRPGIIGQFIIEVGDFIKRIAIKQRKNIKIISMVRNPLNRDISMFFQNLPYWYIHHVHKNQIDIREDGVEFLEEVFSESYDHNYQLEWFDKEIKRLTGIDIFNENYNTKKGYIKIKKGKYELFLFRLEDIDKALPALSDFVGKDIILKEKNIGDKKWYASIYSEFKQKFTKKACKLHNKSYIFFGYDKK
jgi:hypothetical protein